MSRISLAILAWLSIPLAALPACAAPAPGHALGADAQALARECAAKGGTISTEGLARTPHCVLPTKDAGRACRSSSECEAGCLAPADAVPGTRAEGRCKATTEPFGCFAQVEGGKVMPRLCVD